MRDDLTILIQGPINEISLNVIPDYSKFASTIIISTWDITEEKILEIDQKYSEYCKILIYSQPTPDYVNLINTGKLIGIVNDTTFYWQILGIHNGVSICNTKYIIRTRSDEYYKNLEPLISKAKENGFKFTCGNIWFRKKNIKSIHIGDHLYFSKTKLLKNSIKMLLDIQHKKYDGVKNISNLAYMAAGGGGHNTPEQILAKMILINYENVDITSDNNLLDWDDDNLFKKVFDVIDVNKLKPIKWNWTHGGASGESITNESIINNINEY